MSLNFCDSQVTAGLQDYCESQGAARISNFNVAIPISFKVPDADAPERMKANNNFSTLVSWQSSKQVSAFLCRTHKEVTLNCQRLKTQMPSPINPNVGTMSKKPWAYNPLK